MMGKQKLLNQAWVVDSLSRLEKDLYLASAEQWLTATNTFRSFVQSEVIAFLRQKKCWSAEEFLSVSFVLEVIERFNGFERMTIEEIWSDTFIRSFCSQLQTFAFFVFADSDLLALLMLPLFKEANHAITHDRTNYSRAFNAGDAKRLREAAIRYFPKKLKLIRAKKPQSLSPYDWLYYFELLCHRKEQFFKEAPYSIIVHNKVPYWLKVAIRCERHGLDVNQTLSGIVDYQLYTMEELAEKLGVNKTTAVGICLKEDFGAYYQIPGKAFRNETESIHQFEQNIESRIADDNGLKKHPYFYSNLVRLTKHPAAGYPEALTLQYIVHGGKIESESKRLFLQAQRSLSEVLSGRWVDLRFKALDKKDELQIAIDDLVFVKAEIDEYQKNNIIKNSESMTKPKIKKQHALNDTILKICTENPTYGAFQVWKSLKKLADQGDHPILQEVSVWTDPSAQIAWISHTGMEKKLSRDSFQRNNFYKCKSKP